MKKAKLPIIPTGLKGLDNVILGGGLPQYSLNIVCGPPGSGKTIFCYQMLFFNAGQQNKAVCFSTVSEPPIKTLRYLQQFNFFELEKFKEHIKLRDLTTVLKNVQEGKGIGEVINFIREEIEKESASFVLIDSFKAISSIIGGQDAMRRLIYGLAAELSVLQCTAFLIGEYTENEALTDPVFNIADGIIVLSSDRKGYLRRNYIEVLKMRGTDYFAGRHRFLIDSSGINVYPRLKPIEIAIPIESCERKRIKTGIEGLDKMTNGGLYLGSATLLAGQSGTGKTILSLKFLDEGARNGQKGLLVSFEESPPHLFSMAKTLGIELDKLVKEEKIILCHASPVELSVDKFHYQLISLIRENKIERVVIDSISDISITIADPVNLKNYLLSLVTQLSGLGVTLLLSSEMPEERFGVTTTQLSVVIDAIITMRYKEANDIIKRVISVIKMRGSNHDKRIREYEITNDGLVIKE
ncbi:MAG: ATPase domain-containing protein [bacterium]|nr:ATPase domain-containing protein [bacterium]